jgi:hypothetical protein
MEDFLKSEAYFFTLMPSFLLLPPSFPFYPQHNVHLMDGVMFVHSARLPLLHHTLPSLGALKRINTEFCFKADDDFFKSNIRCSRATEPLGCLGDLG